MKDIRYNLHLFLSPKIYRKNINCSRIKFVYAETDRVIYRICSSICVKQNARKCRYVQNNVHLQFQCSIYRLFYSIQMQNNRLTFKRWRSLILRKTINSHITLNETNTLLPRRYWRCNFFTKHSRYCLKHQSKMDSFPRSSMHFVHNSEYTMYILVKKFRNKCHSLKGLKKNVFIRTGNKR